MLSPREKRSRKRWNFLMNILTCIQSLGILISAIYMYYAHFYNNNYSYSRIIGLIIAIPSYILWVTARLQLGTSFSYFPIASTLVTHGLFARISHPIYLFSSLTLFGYILYIDKVLWLSCFLLIIPIQCSRAYYESKALSKEYGEEYDDYKDELWI